MKSQPQNALLQNQSPHSRGSVDNDIDRGYLRLLHTVLLGSAKNHGKRRRFIPIPVLCLAVIASFSQLASAATAPITWGAPTPITGNTDVNNTTGTLFAAANYGGIGVQPTTVNGVLFNPFVTDGSSTTFTSGNLTLSSAGFVTGGSTFGTFSPPFSNLSAAYQTLLASASDARGLSLSISGLTPGQSYFVELWANLSDLTAPVQEIVSAGNSTALVFNTTSTSGGVGQFVTGTFTANGPTELITLANSGSTAYSHAILNAVEVRTLSVPEPSVWQMMCAGGVCLLATMHLRRRRV